MLSHTAQSLEKFDNQHDFERMAADTLNALGYEAVQPMAPAGGSDRGTDIAFHEGDSPGIAFVTLDKNIRRKFTEDLAKHKAGEGVIALFCNVNVTPKNKIEFTKEAIKKGYRLEIFDLERLRSLLDSSLKEIRRRYLHIDDEIATKIRSQVKRLLRFPEATTAEDPPTLIEAHLANALPRRLFDLLIGYDEQQIKEVPEIGELLREHLVRYHEFRRNARQIEEDLMLRIGQSVGVSFPAAWRIFLRYLVIRFGGATKEQIISWGNSLNYSITWDHCEQLFVKFSQDSEVSSRFEQLFTEYTSLEELVEKLRKSSAA